MIFTFIEVQHYKLICVKPIYNIWWHILWHQNILTIIMLLIFQCILEKNIKDRCYLVQIEMSLVIFKNISCLYCKRKNVALNRNTGLLKYLLLHWTLYCQLLKACRLYYMQKNEGGRSDREQNDNSSYRQHWIHNVTTLVGPWKNP